MFENTNIKANNKFTIVGLILMNVSSCKNKVKEPKNSTNIPITIGIIGIFPSIFHAIGITIAVAAINAAVA